MPLPSIGDVVDDKFRIERKLGEGATSTIFEVRHAVTDKRFAIKWLAPELAQNEQAVQLFIHEAKVCGRLEHPNAVQIYDICRNRDSYYLLMELLEGESLETRLSRVRRLSARAACDLLLPCTEALSAAHRLGIVHRDLKPSNIFLCNVEGRNEELPKVLDFGISKLSYKRSERTGPISGTPLYMAPEQMRGQPPDPRFDIYALGVVLYELVAGQPPFDCENLEELAQKIMESEPTPLDQLAQVEPAFAEIVARAMAREVDDRFATMAELAHALRPYGSPRPSPSAPAGVIEQPRLSEPPIAAPARRSMKATQPGVWVVMPAAAAEMAAAEEEEGESEAEVRVVATSAPEPAAAAPEPAASAPHVEAESSSDIPLIDAEPEPEPEPEASAPEASAPVAPLPATESGPRLRQSPAPARPAPVVARRLAPPPPAAALPAEFDDLDVGAHRPRAKRWLGTAIALGGAALTWYALTRTPERPPAPVASSSSATQVRPALPEAETTALRAAPPTAEISPHPAIETSEHVQPRRTQALKSATKSLEPARAKPTRRTAKPKRSTPAKESIALSRRSSAPRESAPATGQGLSLPSADLSRQDF